MVHKKKESDFKEIMKQMAKSDLDQLSIDLKGQRSEIEKQLAGLSPFKQEGTVKMIIDYALLLNSLHKHSTTEKPDHDGLFEHLIAATYSVAYAVGQGADVVKTLPIMAVMGVNEKLGKKILHDYDKEAGQISKSKRQKKL
jgi:hypothetical protein